MIIIPSEIEQDRLPPKKVRINIKHFKRLDTFNDFYEKHITWISKLDKPGICKITDLGLTIEQLRYIKQRLNLFKLTFFEIRGKIYVEIK